MVCSDAPAACAIAANVEIPMHFLPAQTAKAFVVASPMRKPVKLPGPDAAANRSISSSLTQASCKIGSMLSSKLIECDSEAFPSADERISEPRARATLPERVAVSMARINGFSEVDIVINGAVAAPRLTRAEPDAMILN